MTFAQTESISIKKENTKSYQTKDDAWTFSTIPQTISGLTEPDTLIISGDTILTDWPDTLIINFANDFYGQYNGHTTLRLDTIINESPLVISKVIVYGAQCGSCEFIKISEDAVAPYDFTIPDIKLRLAIIATAGTGKISTKTTLKKTESVGISIDSVNALISDSIAGIGGGGGALSYYEVDARLFYDVAEDTLGIDTIFLNTFPGNWTIMTSGDPLSFEFNCLDCDGTVTFTNSFPLTTNDHPQGALLGFDAGIVPYLLQGGWNNGKSTVWGAYKFDGTQPPLAAWTLFPYFNLSFRYYHN